MITKLTFIDDSNKRVPAAIRKKAPAIVSALTERVLYWMLQLQDRIHQKLDGGVLQHRSGRLLGSFGSPKIQRVGSSIIGTVEGAGGPAWYGQIHEDGGTFNVKEYVRRIGFDKKGHFTKLLNHSGSVRAAIKSMDQTVVHAHTVSFPARPFAKPSLEEITGGMIADLQRTVGMEIQR